MRLAADAALTEGGRGRRCENAVNEDEESTDKKSDG
jgi:hypothetical protein